MIIIRSKRFLEAGIPEIDGINETATDKNMSDPELRASLINWLKKTWQGKSVFNKALKDKIDIPRRGIDKLEGMLAFREQILATKRIDKILSESIIDDWNFDQKGRKSVDSYVYLTCKCKINSKMFKITSYIRKTINSPLKFYGFILIDIKIEAI